MRSPTSPIRSASRASLAILTAVLAASACTTSATVVPSVPVASPNQTAVASAPASAAIAPSVAPTAAVSPSSPAACPSVVVVDVAPSDRLIGAKINPGTGHDTLTFTFGKSSGQPSGTAPTRELRPTTPPFVFGASGLPVNVAGERFIAITFRGMAVSDEQGRPTYDGGDDIHLNLLAIREVRLIEAFEGVVTWIVGVNGPGCLAVSRLTGPDRIVVSVTQP